MGEFLWLEQEVSLAGGWMGLVGSLIGGKQPVLGFVLEKTQEGLLEACIMLMWRGDEGSFVASNSVSKSQGRERVWVHQFGGCLLKCRGSEFCSSASSCALLASPDAHNHIKAIPCKDCAFFCLCWPVVQVCSWCLRLLCPQKPCRSGESFRFRRLEFVSDHRDDS